MTIARLVELLQDLGNPDLDVQLEIGETLAGITDVYVDDAHGCVFIAGEED